MVQAKLELNTRKYVRNVDGRNGKNHLLTGLLRCPECGAPMYHNITRKKKKTGGQYKEYSYYACKHRYGIKGHKCSYNKQVSADLIESAVNEVIIKLVRKPEFADIMKSRINSKVDTVELDKEIAALEAELRRIITLKSKLIEESDALDPEDKHFERMKNDLSDRIYKLYDKIDEIEESLNTARKKKIAINTAKLEADNIYKTLMYFDTLYYRMNKDEQRELLSILINEINIYNDKQPNGQWLKEIRFSLPIIADEQLYMSLDNGNHVDNCFMQPVNKQIILLVDSFVLISGSMNLFCLPSPERYLSVVNRVVQNKFDERSSYKVSLSCVSDQFSISMFLQILCNAINAQLSIHILIEDNAYYFRFIFYDN